MVAAAIHARLYDDAGGSGLEVLALDRGRGMADFGRCMEDGYSTAGSPGTGLGAIKRLTDEMRAYSRPGLGTAIMVRILHRPGTGRGMLAGAVLAPYPGEQVCGDNWAFSHPQAGPTLLLADGAGHGVDAARAAEAAIQTFAAHIHLSCEEIVAALHRTLAPTRGAAVRSPGLTWRRGQSASSVSATSAPSSSIRAVLATWCRTTARPGTSRRAFANSPMSSMAVRW